MSQATPLKFSLTGAVELSELEEMRTHAYDDGFGYLTIGVGHVLTQSELSSGKLWISGEPYRWPDGLNPIEVLQLLEQDITDREEVVSDLVCVPLNQHQFDALVIFVFNVGGTAFAGSTLLKRLNDGQYGQVPAQMRRWIHAGGKRVEGLIRRREFTINIWNGRQ